MNKTLQNILRWIAVLPGSLAAGILSTFLLHFVLYITLTKFVTPYPELPERALTPFVVALTLIWTGSEIAPKQKLKVAVILFSIWIFFAGGLIMTTYTGANWFGKSLYLDAKGIAPVLGIAGAFVGLYLVWRKNGGYQKPTSILQDEKEEEIVDAPSSNESNVKKTSFYDRYGPDIFNLIFVALFVWCIFSSTARIVIFISLLLMNLYLIYFSWKEKLHSTTTMKINLTKNIVMAVLLIVGLFYSKIGSYVALLCVVLQSFDLLRHLVVTHVITKNGTTAQQ